MPSATAPVDRAKRRGHDGGRPPRRGRESPCAKSPSPQCSASLSSRARQQARRCSTDPWTGRETTRCIRTGARRARSISGSRPQTTQTVSRRWSATRRRATSATGRSTTSGRTSSPRTEPRSGDGSGASSWITTSACATRLRPSTRRSPSTRAIRSSSSRTTSARSTSPGLLPLRGRASSRRASRSTRSAATSTAPASTASPTRDSTGCARGRSTAIRRTTPPGSCCRTITSLGPTHAAARTRLRRWT